MRRLYVPLLSCAAMVGASASAQAATNGPIFYTQYTSNPLPPFRGETSPTGDYEVSGNIRAIEADGSRDRVIVTSKDASEDGAAPSPDGRSLIYTKSGQLWRSAIDGTSAVRVGQIDQAELPAWSPDGTRVAIGDEEAGIQIVDLRSPAAKPKTIIPATPFRPGGPPEIVILAGPTFTPAGDALVYLRLKADFRGPTFKLSTSFWTAGADGASPRRLFRGSGETRSVLAFSISPDGTQIAYTASSSWKKAPRRLFVSRLDGSGGRQLAVAPAGHSNLGTPAWSPDGTKLALPVNESSPARGGQLWLVDGKTGAHTVLKTMSKGLIDEPKWQSIPTPAPAPAQ